MIMSGILINLRIEMVLTIFALGYKIKSTGNDAGAFRFQDRPVNDGCVVKFYRKFLNSTPKLWCCCRCCHIYDYHRRGLCCHSCRRYLCCGCDHDGGYYIRCGFYNAFEAVFGSHSDAAVLRVCGVTDGARVFV